MDVLDLMSIRLMVYAGCLKNRNSLGFLLHASVLDIIENYSIQYGVLAIDDNGAERTKIQIKLQFLFCI